MSNTAVSAADPALANEPAPVPAISKREPSPLPAARAARARTKKPETARNKSAKKGATSVARRSVAPQAALASPSTSQAKTQFTTFLVGAGVGAAVTLSVVAFGSKRGRGSALAVAVTKSITYAIARTTANGSLLNLVARAVGGAIA